MLPRLGILVDHLSITKIFKELDINGDGSIDEKEFYALFKQSRVETST